MTRSREDPLELPAFTEQLGVRSTVMTPVTLGERSPARRPQPLLGRGRLFRRVNGGAPNPPEVIPRVFDRFSRGPGSQGSGLGLYLAREIIVGHGGAVRVDSGVAAGARFVVTLPVR